MSTSCMPFIYLSAKRCDCSTFSFATISRRAVASVCDTEYDTICQKTHSTRAHSHTHSFLFSLHCHTATHTLCLCTGTRTHNEIEAIRFDAFHPCHLWFSSVGRYSLLFFCSLSTFILCAYQLFLPGSRCLLSAAPCKMPEANNFVRNTPMRSKSYQTPAFSFFCVVCFFSSEKYHGITFIFHSVRQNKTSNHSTSISSRYLCTYYATNEELTHTHTHSQSP